MAPRERAGRTLSARLARAEDELRGAGTSFDDLCRRFGLDGPQRSLLLGALAPLLDPAILPLYHQLQGRPWATEPLVARLFGHGRRALLRPDSPLVPGASCGPPRAPPPSRRRWSPTRCCRSGCRARRRSIRSWSAPSAPWTGCRRGRMARRFRRRPSAQLAGGRPARAPDSGSPDPAADGRASPPRSPRRWACRRSSSTQCRRARPGRSHGCSSSGMRR